MSGTPRRRVEGPERIYVLTGGRSGAAGHPGLDLVTLIVARCDDGPSLIPEHRAILRMCRRPLSAAEVSAHLRLPFSATAVLISDLLSAGLAVERKPVKPAVVDLDLLKDVILGLQRL